MVGKYSKTFYHALLQRYKSEIKEHALALTILTNEPVGIGEHTNYTEEAHKHISGIAQAKENIEALEAFDTGGFDG